MAALGPVKARRTRQLLASSSLVGATNALNQIPVADKAGANPLQQIALHIGRYRGDRVRESEPPAIRVGQQLGSLERGPRAQSGIVLIREIVNLVHRHSPVRSRLRLGLAEIRQRKRS